MANVPSRIIDTPAIPHRSKLDRTSAVNLNDPPIQSQ
jgi:hypothetical protein